MNRLTIILLILVIGGGAIAYFQLSEDKPENEKIRAERPRDFSIRKADDVYKILIADNEGRIIKIARENRNSDWIINGKYKARLWSVENILDNIKNTQIRSIPSDDEQKFLKEAMAVNGIKVVLRDKNDNIVNSFIVGPNSTDGSASYFMKEGEDVYMCEVKSFVGSPREVFEAKVKELRSVDIITNDDKNINQIIVDYPRFKNESFVLRKDNGNFSIETLYDVPEASTELKQNIAKSYYQSFDRVFGEAYFPDLSFSDSLLNEQPYAELKVIKEKDDTFSVSLWPTESIEKILDADRIEGKPGSGKMLPRLWVYTSNDDWMKMQVKPNQEIFRGYSFFFE